MEPWLITFIVGLSVFVCFSAFHYFVMKATEGRRNSTFDFGMVLDAIALTYIVATIPVALLYYFLIGTLPNFFVLIGLFVVDAISISYEISGKFLFGLWIGNGTADYYPIEVLTPVYITWITSVLSAVPILFSNVDTGDYFRTFYILNTCVYSCRLVILLLVSILKLCGCLAES